MGDDENEQAKFIGLMQQWLMMVSIKCIDAGLLYFIYAYAHESIMRKLIKLRNRNQHIRQFLKGQQTYFSIR